MKYSHLFGAMLPSLALVFSACSFQQEDFFEESAAIRIQHVNQEIKSKLVAGSTNGWLMQYFVAGTDDYTFEGFNLFGRFTESGSAKLSGDHRFLRNGNAGKYTEYTSCYQMINEEGSVLAFDTWNDVLSVFVDPVDPGMAPNTLVNNGEGMNGDDRLVNLWYNDDEMLFRGERHGGRVRFIKLNCTPEEYLAKANYMKTVIANEKVTEYKVTTPDSVMYISGLNQGHFLLCDRLDDPLKSVEHSCVFTPAGFDLPLGLQNDSCRVFKVNADTTAIESDGMVITPCWIRGIVKAARATGGLKITGDGACDSFATLYANLVAAIKSQFATQNFSYITFGTSSEATGKNRTGLVFMATNASGNKLSSAFTGTVVVNDDETATISIDPEDGSYNFTNNYAKKGIGSSFTDIVNALNGSYRLEVDNPFNPKSLRWVKTTDPSFYFSTAL